MKLKVKYRCNKHIRRYTWNKSNERELINVYSFRERSTICICRDVSVCRVRVTRVSLQGTQWTAICWGSRVRPLSSDPSSLSWFVAFVPVCLFLSSSYTLWCLRFRIPYVNSGFVRTLALSKASPLGRVTSCFIAYRRSRFMPPLAAASQGVVTSTLSPRTIFIPIHFIL